MGSDDWTWCADTWLILSVNNQTVNNEKKKIKRFSQFVLVNKLRKVERHLLMPLIDWMYCRCDLPFTRAFYVPLKTDKQHNMLLKYLY